MHLLIVEQNQVLGEICRDRTVDFFIADHSFKFVVIDLLDQKLDHLYLLLLCQGELELDDTHQSLFDVDQ